MRIKQLLYLIIYSKNLNCFIRNIIKPFKKWLPKALRISPSGTIKIRSEGGIVKIATNQTNYVTNLIFWEGYKQFEYTKIFCELIKDISCFYDVGANIGYYSLLAARINPDIFIRSFEAATGPLYYLRRNIGLNKFHNISVEPVALSNTNGEIKFIQHINPKYHYIKHSLGGKGRIGSQESNNSDSVNKVKSMTLDDFVISVGDKNIDLIKIDTEGTEDLILSKSQAVISQMKPIIICETLYNRIESRIEELVAPHDYLFFNHYPNGLHRVDTLKRKWDDGVRNCFLVHPSRVELITDYIS